MALPSCGLILTGVSGWSEPAQVRSGRPSLSLEQLAGQFDTVEIADTFRRMPRPERSRVWMRRVGSNRRFVFTACLHSGFTEGRTLDEALAREFRSGLAPLMENGSLGAVLLQFPWSFRFTAENREYLIRLRRSLHPLPLVAEFPHASWAASEAIGTLIDYKIGFCNLDQIQQVKRTAPSSFLTSATGYVRLRGRAPDGGPFDYAEPLLEEWCGRVRHISGFADRVFVIAANGGAASSVRSADKMRNLLQRPGSDSSRRVAEPLRSRSRVPAPSLVRTPHSQPLLERLDAIAVA